jgi:hypothetical protein
MIGSRRNRQRHRPTIDVPESLHTRVKIACAQNKLKMNTLILEGVHRALER